MKVKVIAEIDTAGYRHVPRGFSGCAYIGAPHGKTKAVRDAVKAADSGGTVQDPGDGRGARDWIAHALTCGAVVCDRHGNPIV